MRIESRTDDAVRLNFPSILAEVDQACHMVQGLLHDRLPAEDHFMLLLCLREALTNAVIHGNRSDPEKTVTCTFAIKPDCLEIVIQDQGAGFAWKKRNWDLPPPTSESGRGLAIIRCHFEEIVFNGSGNEMTLRKRLEASGAKDMLQIQQDGSRIIVKATENMVGSKIEELRMEFTKVVRNDHLDLTIDLSAVDMVDSMGMGLLVATHNSLKARQGRLSLINVKPEIYNVLIVMRLDKHFPIHKVE